MKATKFCNPKTPKYSCESCDYNTSNKTNFEKHLQTEKHFEKINCNIATSSCKKLQSYFCENCDYTTNNKADFSKHRETLKCKSVTKSQKIAKNAEKSHKLLDIILHHNTSIVNDIIVDNCDESVTLVEKSPKIPINPHKIPKIQGFYCKSCDYATNNKKDYKKHCLTTKCTQMSPTALYVEGEPSTLLYSCKCGKEFKARSGLWRHQKTCVGVTNDAKLLELVISNQKQHDETIVKIIEMVKDISKDKSMINSNNNTNCHNKQFNLQFFLNETCKDAYNISEFVEQLDVSIEDMLNTSRVGYTEGVSQIIVNGLKALDENKRPIHCTDAKRETLYIKENNEWNKEADDRPILLGAVKKIAGKNIKQISEWCKQHPNYRDSSSRDNDIHLKMLVNVMQGGTDNEINNSFKTIFHNVATGTRIQKH